MKTVTFTRRELTQLVLVGSVVLSFCSIAASQILLGLALVLFFSLREKPRWPAGMAWAGAFLALTLIAAVASGEPRTALPQMKKLFLWSLLPLGMTLLEGVAIRMALVYGSLFAATASALWSFEEFREKWVAAQAAHEDFYLAYVAKRITGFMSHWMTFSEHMLLAIALGLALLLFGKRSGREKVGLVAVLAVLGVALILAETRSAWLGAACAAGVLLALWRPVALLALPVVAALVFVVSPAPVKQRMTSIVRPHGQTDSNEHRVVTRAVGYQMIAAHPWLGLGPEGPGKHFKDYLPEEYKTQPLPDGYYGHLHNVYLQYAAERGVPALLCLMVFVGLNVRVWLRQKRVLTYFAVAAVAGLAANGLFEHNLGDSEVLTLFLALFGLGGGPTEKTA